MNMQFGDVNVVFKPHVDGKARPYFVAGGGVYYRPVTVTTPGVGYIPGLLRSVVVCVLPGRVRSGREHRGPA